MSDSMISAENKTIQKSENLTNSERFSNMVIKEFKGNVGELNLNEYQKQLIRNYFIGIDNALKVAETSRQFSKKKANEPPITWENVNMNALARDVVQNAKLGLDMSIKNHLHVVPYKNNKTNKYDLNLMPGYEGLKYIASNYSLYKILDIKVELVRETDVFQATSKNNVDGYEFKITNPFSRGNVVGGFGYIRYENEIHNQLVIMSIDELMKRKPSTASAEFWGGTKDKWEDGKHIGKEEIAGWTDEMLYKTMVRATCKKVPVDPKKINDSYIYVMENKDDYYTNLDEEKMKDEISQNANTEEIDFKTSEIIETTAVTENSDTEALPMQENMSTEKIERGF